MTPSAASSQRRVIAALRRLAEVARTLASNAPAQQRGQLVEEGAALVSEVEEIQQAAGGALRLPPSVLGGVLEALDVVARACACAASDASVSMQALVLVLHALKLIKDMSGMQANPEVRRDEHDSACLSADESARFLPAGMPMVAGARHGQDCAGTPGANGYLPYAAYRVAPLTRAMVQRAKLIHLCLPTLCLDPAVSGGARRRGCSGML